jgi:NADPH:quinone reductase-like Zn-dependent oxidoreductase
MRAVHVPAAGEQPVLADLPTPEVSEGTVLVRVHAAGLNPVDNVIASGALSAMMHHEYPLVLGRDAAGVVEAVGDGVDHVAVGDAVVGNVPFQPPLHHGTLAEYALLPAESVIPIPDGLDFTTAAALPLAASAASAAVEACGAEAGQVVLVNGASGGVGRYVVQLLAARGVQVVATGTADDTERLKSLGAATVVDFTGGSVADQVRAAYPDGVDGLIELVAMSPDGSPLGAVKPGGWVQTTTGQLDEAALTAANLTGGTILANPVREVTAPLADQAANGRLSVDVAEVLPLNEALNGLATLAAGQARGKLVVTIQPE